VTQRPPPRTLLEKILREDDFTLEEVCERFDRLARELDTPASLSMRQLQRWIAGMVDSARPASRRVAARLWGRPFEELLGPPNEIDPRPDRAEGLDLPEAQRAALDPPEVSPADVAYESTRHAAQVGGQVDPMSLDQLHAEVWRLARDYATFTPVAVLADSRRARDLTYLLLERTHRPGQTRELYLVAGQLCALMTAASFDLAAWDAAVEQARAAYVYGDLIDHPGLRAWARGDQALIAYWRGDPRRAVALAEDGLEDAPRGTPEARLRCIVARAWSHMGDAARTRRAIGAADAARTVGDGHDDLHDLGGELAWGPSRHAACVGSALLQVGDAVAAADRIHEALALLPDDQHGGLMAERAYCDLAGAELARRQLDMAATALAPVWQLPVAKRRQGVTGRLLGLERALAGRPWRGDRHAADLRDRIIHFNAEASARALPAPVD
jgi:hypothetical protein